MTQLVNVSSYKTPFNASTLFASRRSSDGILAKPAIANQRLERKGGGGGGGEGGNEVTSVAADETRNMFPFYITVFSLGLVTTDLV